jgi:hypothetical protein
MMIPVGATIPVRVPLTITGVALFRVMVAEAVMRLIARMVVTIVLALRVADSGS